MHYLILLILSIFLVACGGDDQKQKADVGKYAPQLNSKPKYFMTVIGTIDPALKNKIQLTWLATYETTNPSCRLIINKWEGVHSSREKTLRFPVLTNAKGRYKFKIPLDRFVKGYCGWELRFVGYKTNLHTLDENTYVSAFFGEDAVKSKQNKVNDLWLCKESCKQVSAGSFSQNQSNNLPVSENYIYRLDFRRR